jgi:ribonuclease P protein component
VRSDRLLRSSEYEHVAQHGRRAASNAFVVLVVSRGGEGSARLGITASRKVGGAVQRNRIKRRVREWFRRERGRVGGPLDVLVIVRRSAVDLEFAELCDCLSRLVDRATRGR